MKKRYIYITVIIALCSFGLYKAQVQPVKTVQAQQVSNDNYPEFWKNLPNGAILDSWGNGIRQCTSWVAFKAYTELDYKVSFWGEARHWVDAARKVSVLVDTTPTINSAAVDTSFSPGHIMWIEKLNEDGSIHISEYNYVDGEYTQRDIKTDGLQFIHFPKIDRSN